MFVPHSTLRPRDRPHARESGLFPANGVEMRKGVRLSLTFGESGLSTFGRVCESPDAGHGPLVVARNGGLRSRWRPATIKSPLRVGPAGLVSPKVRASQHWL